MRFKKTAPVFVGLASLKSAEHEAGGDPGKVGRQSAGRMLFVRALQSFLWEDFK